MGLFDFLFGKKAPPPPKPQESAPKSTLAAPPIDQKEVWVYESILQYLTSPIWLITIQEFQDRHCLIFDDEEENKIEYQNIHKKFKQTVAELVDGMMAELQINEEQFMRAVETGIKHKTDKAIFDQLLIIDNFLVFKKQMLRRNKELELEAVMKMAKQDAKQAKSISGSNMNEIKLAQLAKEKADIEEAIAQSKAIEEERKKLLGEDDKLLQMALQQSLIEYKNYQMQQARELQKKEEEIKRFKLLEEQKYQEVKEMQQQPLLQQQEQHKDDTPTIYSSIRQNPNDPPLAKIVEKPQIEQVQKQVAPQEQEIQVPEMNQPPMVSSGIQHSQQNQGLSSMGDSRKLPSKVLPPLKPPNIVQAESKLIAFEDEPNEQDKQLIRQQEAKLRQQQSGESNLQESLEERKKRMLELKEKLKNKKVAELNEQKELERVQKQQQQQQATDAFELQRKSTYDDIQRRKAQLEQKRKEIQEKKLQQKQEEENEDVDLL